MPNISVTLPETSQSVSRPIIFDIISQVQEITKMDKNTKIFYPGEIQKMQTAGSDIESGLDRSSIFSTERYNHIEVEEEFELGAINTTAVSRREHPPIFLDNELQVRITPVYATTNIVINFTYTCPSESEAKRWHDDIRMRVSQLRDINLHIVSYHYLIPYEFLAILKVIHANREAYLGYDQTLEAYIKSYMTDRLKLIGSLDSSDGRLGVAEQQSRIIGLYDFEGLPSKPKRNDSTGVWEIAFGYKFTYEKPIACFMNYPVIVHNKLLPQGYVDFREPNNDFTQQEQRYSTSIEAFRGFEIDTINQQYYDPDPILRIPAFDDYNITHVPSGTGTVLIALTEVDTADQISLLNLKQLGEIVLDQEILAFMEQVEYPYLTKLYQSVFHLSLYRNEFLANADQLSCDASLNVKAVTPLNLRKQHRVRLAIVTNLSYVKDAAIDRLRAYPKVFAKVLGSVNELIRDHPDLANISQQHEVSARQYQQIYRLITGYGYDGRRASGSSYLTGTQANNWPYFPNPDSLFKDIDPHVMERYRNNRTSRKTVQLTGIVARRLS